MISGLPNKLKELRLKYNLSQKDIAKRLDISPSVVSAYETGERTPSLEKHLAFSHLYKCSTDYLLVKDKENPAIIIITEGCTS
jgi:transcriptional regulator with XRE-family HTH domain